MSNCQNHCRYLYRYPLPLAMKNQQQKGCLNILVTECPNKIVAKYHFFQMDDRKADDEVIVNLTKTSIKIAFVTLNEKNICTYTVARAIQSVILRSNLDTFDGVVYISSYVPCKAFNCYNRAFELNGLKMTPSSRAKFSSEIPPHSDNATTTTRVTLYYKKTSGSPKNALFNSRKRRLPSCPKCEERLHNLPELNPPIEFFEVKFYCKNMYFYPRRHLVNSYLFKKKDGNFYCESVCNYFTEQYRVCSNLFTITDPAGVQFTVDEFEFNIEGVNVEIAANCLYSFILAINKFGKSSPPSNGKVTGINPEQLDLYKQAMNLNNYFHESENKFLFKYTANTNNFNPKPWISLE